MEKKLLLAAADIVEATPRKHFQMDVWGAKFAITKKTDLSKVIGCGTVACALGTIASHPRFQKLGLRLDLPGDSEVGFAYGSEYQRAESQAAVNCTKPVIDPQNCRVFGHVIFKNPETGRVSTDLQAAQKLFGITHAQAVHLFHHHSYGSYDPTPKQVAARIRKFVESDDAIA